MICSIGDMGSLGSTEQISGLAGPGWRTTTAARHDRSEVDLFGDAQRVFQLNAQVAHCAVHFGVAKQELNGAKITGFAVNLRRFCPAQRVGAVSARLKPDGGHPIAHQPSILARRNMGAIMKSAREHILSSHHFWRVCPGRHTIPCVLSEFELNRLTGFALHDSHPFASAFATDEVPDFEAS